MKAAFVIAHCATEPKHCVALEHCIRSLVECYFCDDDASYEIHILDDQSTLPLANRIIAIQKLYPHVPFYVHSNPLPGSGEVGALKWYYDNTISDVAVFMHDSMMALTPIDLTTPSEHVRMLWYFDRYHFMHFDATSYLLKNLKCTNAFHLMQMFTTQQNVTWNGCFGMGCVTNRAALHTLQQTYGLMDLIPHVRTREQRQGFERIFGLLICMQHEKAWTHSLCGNIFDHPNVWSNEWANMSYENKKAWAPVYKAPFLKTWFGR